uniref:Uncharacterized protein n=1 Tax=Nelumbo nucifera TaxID=4432 RepID=A0A822ZI24_NELNU|nr:TPA_asm: hypothetical protein HUJ06_002757 [Nelumbo nucifera]
MSPTWGSSPSYGGTSLCAREHCSTRSSSELSVISSLFIRIWSLFESRESVVTLGSHAHAAVAQPNWRVPVSTFPAGPEGPHMSPCTVRPVQMTLHPTPTVVQICAPQRSTAHLRLVLGSSPDDDIIRSASLIFSSADVPIHGGDALWNIVSNDRSLEREDLGWVLL